MLAKMQKYCVGLLSAVSEWYNVDIDFVATFKFFLYIRIISCHRVVLQLLLVSHKYFFEYYTVLNKVKDDRRTVTISMSLALASLYESWDQRDSYLRPQLDP